MITFNTISQDPFVHLVIDEVKIIDFLTDHKGVNKLKKMEEGIKSPSRPPNLIYVDFFFDSNKKMLFLLMADNKKLGLKFPGEKPKGMEVGRMVLISSTSSKALMQYFSECARLDVPQQGIYYNVQHFLSNAFRRSEIVVQ